MVDSVFTFQNKEKTFEITVRSNFLEVCPNPGEQTIADLVRKYEFYKYMHNTTGPVIRCLIPGKEKSMIYVTDGKFHPPNKPEGVAQINEIRNRQQFNKNFKQLID